MSHSVESELRARFERAGQGHVFADFASLGEEARARFVEQLAAVDLDLVACQAALLGQPAESHSGVALEPPELFPLERDARQAAQAEEARQAGEGLLAAGKVGFLLVAGGQASRLGYDGPKGAFGIGPVSGRSLFEIHARRLLAVRARFSVRVPWYVMTSPANHDATRSFFEGHRYFGLEPRDIRFFAQAMIPTMGPAGKILRAGPGELFQAPNGHGGVLLALEQSGSLRDARERGIEHFSYFQVDNPLARPGDALFLGLHALEGAGMSSKVVAKRDAGEKVGVIGTIGERLGCIEYSDLPKDLREARDAPGKLRFRAGNIAIHMLRRDFVEGLTRGGLQLPWHLAKKKMLVWEQGELVQRDGIKFEAFVFDALGESPRSVTLEVDRALEFSPVKNARGEDSAETARADLCRLHASWVRSAGLEPPPLDESGVHPVEIDPLIAEDAAGFRARPHHPIVTERGHFYVHEHH
ncbi:MAG TPA: UTP--glucose-1-phosphate uridylyltransferase [Planctomycetota bacterium]|nr:UTP--glucose-1-phosphate uridylyltransferase [Planctomycetota bacterium]